MAARTSWPPVASWLLGLLVSFYSRREGRWEPLCAQCLCWEAGGRALSWLGEGSSSAHALIGLTGPHLIPPTTVFSLQDLCCRAIVSCTPVHLIDKLPLPVTIKSHLKSFSMANGMNAVMMHGRSYSLASGAGGSSSKGNSLKRSKSIRPPQSPPQNCSRSNCKIS